MSKLTILSLAYPLTLVGPDAVGGSEQILSAIDRELTRSGHRSLVIAAEGSRISGTLLPAPKAPAVLNESIREQAREAHRDLLRSAIDKYSIDLIHLQGLDFHAYLPHYPERVLATLHLPPDWYPPHVFQLSRSQCRLNCVSHSQLAQCPEVARQNCLVIPNGVDTAKLRFEPNKKNYAAAMGRICPEKGFHHALDAARLARTPLRLAGEIFPYEHHLSYVREQIFPRLDADRVFMGPLRFAQKRALLASAKCLIVSSTVAETSSLVAMEALACGTPVVAFRIGALPEIIEHGRTGFLVSDVNEMADAIAMAGQLDPAACRESAASRFSLSRMTSTYLSLYQHLLGRQTSPVAPAPVDSCSADFLPLSRSA
jgi:glycosyltransferase involved in cell wall biosynthesis